MVPLEFGSIVSYIDDAEISEQEVIDLRSYLAGTHFAKTERTPRFESHGIQEPPNIAAKLARIRDECREMNPLFWRGYVDERAYIIMTPGPRAAGPIDIPLFRMEDTPEVLNTFLDYVLSLDMADPMLEVERTKLRATADRGKINSSSYSAKRIVELVYRGSFPVIAPNKAEWIPLIEQWVPPSTRRDTRDADRQAEQGKYMLDEEALAADRAATIKRYNIHDRGGPKPRVVNGKITFIESEEKI